MASVYRSCSVYAGGKRLAQMTKATLTITANGEDVITDDGWQGYTKGPITSELDLSRAVPIKGDGMNIESKFMVGDPIDVTFTNFNGRLCQVKMSIKTLKADTDASKASTGLDFTAGGGKPELIG